MTELNQDGVLSEYESAFSRFRAGGLTLEERSQAIDQLTGLERTIEEKGLYIPAQEIRNRGEITTIDPSPWVKP